MCPPPLRRHSPNFVIITFHFLTNPLINAHTSWQPFSTVTGSFVASGGTFSCQTSTSNTTEQLTTSKNVSETVFEDQTKRDTPPKRSERWQLNSSKQSVFGTAHNFTRPKHQPEVAVAVSRLQKTFSPPCFVLVCAAEVQKRISSRYKRVRIGMGVYERICKEMEGYYYEVRRMPP